MSACAGAASAMLVDAPGTNGPFQPVALVYLRGENRKRPLVLSFLPLFSFAPCFCVFLRSDEPKNIGAVEQNKVSVCIALTVAGSEDAPWAGFV